MSTSMKRDEAWHTRYSERSTRWSAKPEQSQAAIAQTEVMRNAKITTSQHDNVEFVDLGMGTLRIAKPPTRPAKPRDMLGDRLPVPLESAVLPSILAALRVHPRVAWAERMNTGGTKFGDQYVRFGWKGMSDITGQLRDGRRLEVEGKRVGEHPTADQAAFLETVRRYGGVSFVARSIDDVMRELA